MMRYAITNFPIFRVFSCWVRLSEGHSPMVNNEKQAVQKLSVAVQVTGGNTIG